MALELAANEYGFRVLAAIPILLLGVYVFKSNPKELPNRVFAAFALLWTTWIVSINFVSFATDLETATNWNRVAAYSLALLVPVLLHFILVFPYRSRLLRPVWAAPVLYAAATSLVVLLVAREPLFLREPSVDALARVYSPEFRPSLYFLQSVGFTLATLFLLLRYVFTDVEITRKRLFFVLFAIATYTLYEDIGALHDNADPGFKGQFAGLDADYWQLTLASNAMVILVFFAVCFLVALRSRTKDRRTECIVLLASGLAALVTGFFDPILRAAMPAYPGVLWLWRIVAVALMFYAILRYQLFDLHVRVRAGIKYGSLTTLFAAVFFTVQEMIKDFAGDALGYFAGLVGAAALVFLFTPVQRLIERMSSKVVPPTSTENYERYRSMEIYRAALEGALADAVVSPAELHSLRNLRDKLGVSEGDHALLERDIRAQMEKHTL